MRLSLPPGSIRPLAAEVQEALERLRAEAERTEDERYKALLLHEIGAIEELADDDHAAARDLLASVNADTALKEPLEQLAFLLERRGSFKNLPRLLERMVRVANSDAERVRALRALGDFHCDVSSDFEAGRTAYAAVREIDEEGTLGLDLSIELAALGASDPELHARALASRVKQAEDPCYRAALLLILARLQIAQVKPERAQRHLEEAAELGTPVTLQALTELERLGRLCGDRTATADALEKQAALLDVSSRNQAVRRKNGIDAAELSAAKRADAWLRASQARTGKGERRRAVELAQKARTLLPADLCLLHWILDRKDRLTEAEISALLDQELAGATDPDTITALSLLAAFTAKSKGDADGALDALTRCLEHEPGGLVARALQYTLLLGRAEPGVEFARWLDSMSERLPSGEHRARYQILAATVWAKLGSEGEGQAKTLLSRASAAGANSEWIARTTRMLAAGSSNLSWFLEATQRLLTKASVEERPGLLLELARSSWLNGDETAALFNLEEVSASPGGAWVAAVLLAYGSEPGSEDLSERSERALRALSKLATIEGDGAARFALRHLVATLRHLSKRKDSATTLLEELHQEQPANPVVAHQMKETLRHDDAKAAARVLSRTAEASDDQDVALCLFIQAAVCSWRGDDREGAIRTLKRASELNSDAVGPLLSWALRSAHPDDPEERRLVLEAALSSRGDRRLVALERFGLEVSAPAHRSQATAALDSPDADGDDDLGQAVMLARALWPSSKGHKNALKHLAASGATGNEIALALSFLHERRAEEPSQETLQRLSAGWAKAGALTGCLEWLGATVCNGNTAHEIEARQAVASQLGGSAGAAVRAGSLLVGWLAGERGQALLPPESAATQLANLELSPPGCDPRKRAHSLLQSEAVLTSEASHTALVAAGYNQLLAGNVEESLASFHAALSTAPEDLTAWEGVRVAAKELGDGRLEADALHKLSELTKLPERAASFMRERAELLDASGDEAASSRALERAVELDITHFDTFNRLFRQFRADKRYEKVIDLADRRLEVTNDPKEVAKLCWERARAHRGLGNTDAAMADLDTVRVLDPDHPGPFALAGEIYVTQGDSEKAAEQLSLLCRMENAPDDQRLMSGMAAADLYENALNDLDSAIDVLQGMLEAKLSTLNVRERLARSTAKASRFEEAITFLEQLMAERETHEGRVEAARLAMALCRDELNTPERALAACEKLLSDAPADGEALDFILETDLTSERALSLLQKGRDALLDDAPSAFDLERVVRLARIAKRLGDADLRLTTASILLCTEMHNRELADEVVQLQGPSIAAPTVVMDEVILRQVFVGVLDNPFGELARMIAPYLADVTGPNLKSLGLGRRDRLKPLSIPELYEELAAWMRFAEVSDFDLYVGGEPGGLLLLPGPKQPTLVLGTELQSSLRLPQRLHLMRACLGLVTGTGLVVNNRPEDVAALLGAACAVGDVRLNGHNYATTEQLKKALGKELPRKIRKQIPEIAGRAEASAIDLLHWAKLASRGLDRAMTLLTGDVACVLLGPERLAGASAAEPHFDDRLAELSGFATSHNFRSLRDRLRVSKR